MLFGTFSGRNTFRLLILALGLLLIMIAVRAFAAPLIDLSSVNQYNQLTFGTANLVNSETQGIVAYGGDSTFDNVVLATNFFSAPCPTGNTVIEVDGSVNYTSGNIFGGGGRYTGPSLATGTQTFDCDQDGWTQAPPSVDFATVETNLKNLSNNLTNAAVTGPLKKRTCFISAANTNSDLNVYNINGGIFQNLDQSVDCTLAINASCSTTVVLNVSGTNLDLTNFNLTLSGGIDPSQVLINFPDLQSLTLDNVQIGGTILAPFANVTGKTPLDPNDSNFIIGSLFAEQLSGEFDMNTAPFMMGPRSDCTETFTYDFGDLPNAYMVNLLENGARHEIGDLFLGNGVNNEADGQPSPGADADSFDDGVSATPASWTSNTSNGGSVSTVASGVGCLNGWIDWNEDGDFEDDDEHIIMNALVGTTGTTINFDVQFVPMGSTRYARYRVTERTDVNGQMLCRDDISPVGLYQNGEVEDYLYIFADATAVALKSAETTPTSILIVLLLTLSLGFATAATLRRKAS